MRTEFTCARCGEHKEHTDEHTTGYGINKNDEKICFDCCGKVDAEEMAATGRATLYLTKDNDNVWYVSNWPSTLKMRVEYQKQGRHNMAGHRYDVWFTSTNGEHWHGTQYGENTQLCHCKRIAS